ncbi:MAG: hypothetical protein LBR93_06100 [Treponema sp.]|jgi:hypothetical protein|nr:hypothetical protein [Treponema sp.]
MVKKQPLILLFFTLLLGASCRDPIFYKISREVKPLEPRIKGVPTKFVVYDDGDGYYMYVAAASLHRYKNGGWDNWPSGWVAPPGKVFDLAATTDYLYALVNPERPEVYRWDGDSGSEWEPVEGYSGSPQSIYGEIDADGIPLLGGKVFLGARQGDPSEKGIDYSIFYADDKTSDFTWLNTGGNTGFLTGAALAGAGGTHFISTSGSGAYSWDESAGTTATRVEDISPNLEGIIWAGGTKVFAFSRGADIYEITTSTAPSSGTHKGGASYHFTGAVALWKEPLSKPPATPTKGKILLGIRDSGNYGYVEVPFDLSSGDLDYNTAGGVDLHKPGNAPPSTVTDSSLFDTTLRPHPVNSIFQAPYSVDPNMVVFAAVQGTGSTTNDIDSGVWSYRERDGIWQWNAEE